MFNYYQNYKKYLNHISNSEEKGNSISYFMWDFASVLDSLIFRIPSHEEKNQMLPLVTQQSNSV